MAKGKIAYREGYKYQLATPYIVGIKVCPVRDIVTEWITLTKEGNLTIREGYAWDGASGPAIDTKNFMRGSLVHDALYQLMRQKHLDVGWRETADRELVRICKEDGMCALRRWWVYRGVRRGGESSAEWQDEKLCYAP